MSLSALRPLESNVLTFVSSVSRMSEISLFEYPSISLRWTVSLCLSGSRAKALWTSCLSLHLSGLLSSGMSGIFGVVSLRRLIRSMQAFLTALARNESMFLTSSRLSCFRRILSATSCIMSRASSLCPRMLQASLNMKSSLFRSNMSFPLSSISAYMTHKCTKRVIKIEIIMVFGRDGDRSLEPLS